jgi:hypothetical protein
LFGTEVGKMAANAILVLLGAISIAGVGIGAATVSNMPCGGPHNGGCGANGHCPNGAAAGARGGCSPANPVCTQADNGTCPYADGGACPYLNQTNDSG